MHLLTTLLTLQLRILNMILHLINNTLWDLVESFYPVTS